MSRQGGTRRSLVCTLAAIGALLAFGAAPALANAPNPIAGTTVLNGVTHNGDGTITVTVSGQWNWTNQKNCPQARNGVGYQVAWFDGSSANPIGTTKSPVGVLYVGDSVDNIVHSIEPLAGSTASGNAFWDGVPANYLTHNATSPTPNATDAKGWLSNCDNVGADGFSSGTWGPISHTYPPGTASVTLCPVMYDPHGGSDNSGKSSVTDITAGGKGHNGDNSYEANGVASACQKQQLSIPAQAAPVKPSPTKPAHKHKKKHHKKHHVKPKKISRPPRVSAGFTG